MERNDSCPACHRHQFGQIDSSSNAYRVPDLKLDLLAVYVDHPRTKLNSYQRV